MARKSPIPGEIGLGARFGGVGKDTREVEELRAKWIWNLWRGARESGRRARTASSAVHGGPRKEKKRNGSASESEGRWRAREDVVDDLTTFDGRATRRRSSTATHGFGRTPPAIPCAVRNREKRG